MKKSLETGIFQTNQLKYYKISLLSLINKNLRLPISENNPNNWMKMMRDL
jgi:hypothetical protein